MALVIKNSRRKQRKPRKSNPDSVGQYASDAWSLAKRTAVGLNEIRKLINIETKFFDYSFNNTIGATTVTPISLMAQGLTSVTRVGDSIRLQHIEATFQLITNTASAGSRARITVLRDLDGAGTYPTAALIYANTGSVVAIQASPMKFNELERFSVLYDEVLTTCNGTYAGMSRFSVPHNGHIKFLGETAVEGSCGKGTIYLVVTGSEAANQPTLTLSTRIMYTDD